MFETDTHIYFYGSPFSQWQPTPFLESETGKEFNTAEQYMMYHKAMTFKSEMNKKIAECIMKTDLPWRQKRLGKWVEGFKKERWDEVKFDIVMKANIMKFTSSVDLLEFILSTGEKEIVEASPTDRIWGIGLSLDDDRVEDKSQWRGENLLGKACMAARDYIRDVERMCQRELSYYSNKYYTKA